MLTAAWVASLLAASACDAGADPPGESDRPETEHAGEAVAPDRIIRRVVSGVAGAGESSIARLSGGRIQPVTRLGKVPAIRFPAFDPAVDGARAIIRLRAAATATGALDPGERDFVFGADVRLARGPTAQDTGTDNGDNLVQRGLASDPSQYKLQLDGGIVSCRVAGTLGSVTVVGPRVIRGVWYRVSCQREGSAVTLLVSRLTANGPVETVATLRNGEVGEVRLPQGTPFSIGGKLRHDGGLVRSASDQFNGSVGRVTYRRLR